MNNNIKRTYMDSIENDTRNCDVSAIKEIMFKTALSMKDACWEFAVASCKEEWADALKHDYFQGTIELAQFLNLFLTPDGWEELETEMAQVGCVAWAFTALTWGNGSDLKPFKMVSHQYNTNTKQYEIDFIIIHLASIEEARKWGKENSWSVAIE